MLMTSVSVEIRCSSKIICLQTEVDNLVMFILCAWTKNYFINFHGVCGCKYLSGY